jgi:hypothetical protein
MSSVNSHHNIEEKRIHHNLFNPFNQNHNNELRDWGKVNETQKLNQMNLKGLDSKPRNSMIEELRSITQKFNDSKTRTN